MKNGIDRWLRSGSVPGQNPRVKQIGNRTANGDDVANTKGKRLGEEEE